jgi:hypothetical protein
MVHGCHQGRNPRRSRNSGCSAPIPRTSPSCAEALGRPGTPRRKPPPSAAANTSLPLSVLGRPLSLPVPPQCPRPPAHGAAGPWKAKFPAVRCHHRPLHHGALTRQHPPEEQRQKWKLMRLTPEHRFFIVLVPNQFYVCCLSSFWTLDVLSRIDGLFVSTVSRFASPIPDTWHVFLSLIFRVRHKLNFTRMLLLSRHSLPE